MQQGHENAWTSSLELGSVASMPCKIPKLGPERGSLTSKPSFGMLGEASLRCWDVGEILGKRTSIVSYLRNWLCANFWGHRKFQRCIADQMPDRPNGASVGPEELKNLLPSTTSRSTACSKTSSTC